MAKNSFAKDILKTQKTDDDTMISPVVIDWLIKSGRYSQFIDGEGMEIVLDVLQDQNKRIDERKTRTSFGGSSSANCMREQVLNVRLGNKNLADPDYRLANIFEDGVWRNLRWILTFYKVGVLKEYEHTTFSSEYNFSWTPDCILDLSKYYGKKYSHVPVEIKGMNENEFKNFQGRAGRSKWALSRTMQVHAYMLASGAKYWMLWAENKNNQDFDEYKMPRDETVISYLKKRYLYMQKALSDNKLPAVECEMDDSDVKFVRCSRSKDCSKLVKLSYPSLKPMKNRV